MAFWIFFTYCKLGFAIRVDVNVTFALDFPESKCWPGLHRDLLWIQIMPIDSARVAGNWHPAIACWTCRDCRQESIIFRLEIQFGGWKVQNNQGTPSEKKEKLKWAIKYLISVQHLIIVHFGNLLFKLRVHFSKKIQIVCIGSFCEHYQVSTPETVITFLDK